MRKQSTVFIIRDNSVFFKGLRTLLTGRDDFEIIGVTTPKEYLKKRIALSNVDIVILDLDILQVDGIQLIDLILDSRSKINVLVLSSSSNSRLIYDTLTQGVKSFLPKSCKEEELLNALIKVGQGESYLNKTCSEKIIEYLTGQRQRRLDRMMPLTNREIEVLRLVAKGLTNSQIGVLLNISPRTVDTHRRNIMEKLNLHNAVQLANYVSYDNV